MGTNFCTSDNRSPIESIYGGFYSNAIPFDCYNKI